MAAHWNGQPVYNFALIPEAHVRDAFWVAKHAKSAKTEDTQYEDIRLPKNTPFPMLIAGFAFLVGFGIVWHIWWLAILGFLGVVSSIIIRSTDENTEYTITAAELKNTEAIS
jgi:cytochrome o ubiquinol oxidase subunit 1